MKKTKFISMVLCLILAISLMPPMVTAKAMVSSEDYSVESVGSSEDILSKYVDFDSFKAEVETTLSEMETQITVVSHKIPADSDFFDGVAKLIFEELADVFHVEQILLYSLGEYAAHIEIKYLYTEEEYISKKAEYDEAIAETVLGIKGNDALSDMEKALLLHDRLALMCEYDFSYSKLSGYDALVGGTGVCKAYAKAYMALLEEVGIKSQYVYSEKLNHAWNIVYIDGKPYHVDVAWDDPAWKNGDRGVVGFVMHDYFLLSTEAIIEAGHEADDYISTPTDTTYDDYFWKKSTAAFVVVGSEIYYIDSDTHELKRYSDGKVLVSVYDAWKKEETTVWLGNFSKLATDGKSLYYSTSKAVWKYNIAQGKSTKIFTPDLTGFNSIYGLQYKDGYLICDTNVAPPYSGGDNLNQISFKLEAGEQSIVIKSGSSLSSDGTYLYGIQCDDTVSKLLSGLDNNCAIVCDGEGNQLAQSDICYTGCVIKLVKDGETLDALTVVILGDVDGNGKIDSTDYMRVKSNFISSYELSGAAFCAADVTRDGVVDATDYMRIKSVFLGTFSGTL